MPGHGQDSFLCCTADPRFGKACGTGLGRARGRRSNGVSWRPSGGSDSVPMGLECAFAVSSREPLPWDPEVGTPARQPLSLSARPDVPAGRSQCWRGRELSVPASRTSRWREHVPARAGSASHPPTPPPREPAVSQNHPAILAGSRSDGPGALGPPRGPTSTVSGRSAPRPRVHTPAQTEPVLAKLHPPVSCCSSHLFAKQPCHRWHPPPGPRLPVPHPSPMQAVNARGLTASLCAGAPPAQSPRPHSDPGHRVRSPFTHEEAERAQRSTQAVCPTCAITHLSPSPSPGGRGEGGIAIETGQRHLSSAEVSEAVVIQ